jgi:hypothetical protein
MVDVTVFEIYPAANKPMLKNIATHRIFSAAIQAFALTPDRFTYHCDFLITTWDFVEGTSATVHVYQPMMSVRTSLSYSALVSHTFLDNRFTYHHYWPARRWNRRHRDPAAPPHRHACFGNHRGAHHSSPNVQSCPRPF